MRREEKGRNTKSVEQKKGGNTLSVTQSGLYRK